MGKRQKSYEYIIWKEKENKYGVYLIKTRETVYVGKEIVRILWQEEKELAEEEKIFDFSSLKTPQSRQTATIKHPLSLDFLFKINDGKSTPYWLISKDDIERDVIFAETYREMMEILSPSQRAVIINRIRNDDSIRVIARKNGMSKSALGRCLKKIKEIVSQFFLNIISFF